MTSPSKYSLLSSSCNDLLLSETGVTRPCINVPLFSGLLPQGLFSFGVHGFLTRFISLLRSRLSAPVTFFSYCREKVADRSPCKRRKSLKDRRGVSAHSFRRLIRHDWERVVEQLSLLQQEQGGCWSVTPSHVWKARKVRANAGALPGFFLFIPYSPQLMGQCLLCSG